MNPLMNQIVTGFFDTQKKIIQKEKIAEDICPDCKVLMEYTEDEGYYDRPVDRDCEPEFIRTGKVYICPGCLKKVTIPEPIKKYKK